MILVLILVLIYPKWDTMVNAFIETVAENNFNNYWNAFYLGNRCLLANYIVSFYMHEDKYFPEERMVVYLLLGK